jgi:hypothetical protein
MPALLNLVCVSLFCSTERVLLYDTRSRLDGKRRSTNLNGGERAVGQSENWLRVAIVGSGPAGMDAPAQLRASGGDDVAEDVFNCGGQHWKCLGIGNGPSVVGHPQMGYAG